MKHLTEPFKVSYRTYSSKNVELERSLKLAIVISVPNSNLDSLCDMPSFYTRQNNPDYIKINRDKHGLSTMCFE